MAFSPSGMRAQPPVAAASDDAAGAQWDDEIETLISSWHLRGTYLRTMHTEAARHYARLDMALSLPNTFMVAMLSTSLFASGSFPDLLGRPFIFTCGVAAALSAALAAVHQVMQHARRSQKHHHASILYGSLCGQMEAELAYRRPQREEPKSFSLRCQTARDNIEKTCPVIPLYIERRYMQDLEVRLKEGNIRVNHGGGASTSQDVSAINVSAMTGSRLQIISEDASNDTDSISDRASGSGSGTGSGSGSMVHAAVHIRYDRPMGVSRATDTVSLGATPPGTPPTFEADATHTSAPPALPTPRKRSPAASMSSFSDTTSRASPGDPRDHGHPIAAAATLSPRRQDASTPRKMRSYNHGGLAEELRRERRCPPPPPIATGRALHTLYDMGTLSHTSPTRSLTQFNTPPSMH
jgi:hypothetical protein